MAKKQILNSNLVSMDQVSNKEAFTANTEAVKACEGFFESLQVEDAEAYTEMCNEFLGDVSEFQEDSGIANSGQFLIQKIANMAFAKTYDKFQKYMDMVTMWTPEDFGGLSQSASYKIPKIFGATAVKLAPGQTVEYVDVEKAETLITTERYGTGMRINDRFLERAGPGVVSKFVAHTGKAVQREIWQTVANAMVIAAPSATVINTGISVESIQDAKEAMSLSKDGKGVLFGLEADTLSLTQQGKTALIKSDTYKLIFTRNNQIVGSELKLNYPVYDGMNVIVTELITELKAGKIVQALVLEKDSYMQYIQDQSSMKIWNGRLPGTAGDMEYIFALDMGFGVAVDAACVVITEA